MSSEKTGVPGLENRGYDDERGVLDVEASDERDVTGDEEEEEAFAGMRRGEEGLRRPRERSGSAQWRQSIPAVFGRRPTCPQRRWLTASLLLQTDNYAHGRLSECF
ncbi:hypothetical protein EIP91_011794 [Steccherinum ochraceum]|uniref:Uncharacterized protein n=1 Tax=Steccherinum ochraceum TaxID=92696 RepID=A0A4R0RHF9_9APHY|nr:hypothetical protein EIP91_011794 [Steccherinum ochraceum]